MSGRAYPAAVCARALDLVRAGATYSDAAAACGVSLATVGVWAKRDGARAPRPRGEAKPRVWTNYSRAARLAAGLCGACGGEMDRTTGVQCSACCAVAVLKHRARVERRAAGGAP